MTTNELKLKNYNNCLACDAFLQIHFAPQKEVCEQDLNKIYYVKNEGEEMYVKLVDILRFHFADMPGIATIPATGMEAADWRTWWLTQYPQTKPATMMCVYYYKKHKG